MVKATSKRTPKAKPIPAGNPGERIRFYRNKRIIFPLLASLGATFLTHNPVVGAAVYIFAFVFLTLYLAHANQENCHPRNGAGVIRQGAHQARPAPAGDPKGRARFYCNKRIIRPLGISIGAAFITHDAFLSFLAYVLAGLFLDWLFFTQNGYRDSDQLPEADFRAMGLTGAQVDQRNRFIVAIRRWAFGAGVSTAAAYALLDPSLPCRAAFVLTYIGFTLVAVMIAISRGTIVSRLRFSNARHQFSPYPSAFGGFGHAAPGCQIAHLSTTASQPEYDPFSYDIIANPLAYKANRMDDHSAVIPEPIQTAWNPASYDLAVNPLAYQQDDHSSPSWSDSFSSCDTGFFGSCSFDTGSSDPWSST